MSEAELAQFTGFYYPEIRDLTLRFLGLVTTVFTISLVLADKFVIGKRRLSRKDAPLVASWALFLAALAIGGLGLYLLFIAAEVAHGQLVYQYGKGVWETMRWVYTWLDVAAACFGLGLVGLTVSAVRRLGASSAEDRAMSLV